MKLVDILARELKEWPAECTSGYCVQDDDTPTVFFGGPAKSILLTEIAEDTRDARVTRPQWQAAVDALKAGEKEWDGEGLPPVGVEIDISHRRAQPDWANPGFYKAVIVAMGAQLMILKADGNGHEKVATIADYHFRPIRTAEQIAAEEREKAIKLAIVELDLNPDDDRYIAEKYYDAGYRKQVQP